MLRSTAQFELRSDAFKMTVNVRRPTPSRTETLGPWLHTLGFITWLAAITNSGLVYLYRPHPDHACDPLASNPLVGVARQAMNATANALNSTMLAPEKATFSPREAAYATSNIHLASSHEGTYSALRATMFSALLVALASEHGYLVARTAVRHVIERLLWRGTEEEIALRRGEERLKVGYMEGMGLEIPKVRRLALFVATLSRSTHVHSCRRRIRPTLSCDGRWRGRLAMRAIHSGRGKTPAWQRSDGW